MADRNVSFDILAADKASESLAKVGREVAELGAKVDAAGGDIPIDADTTKAREKIAAIDSQLGKLNAKSLKIDADIAGAERNLAVLQAELKRTTDEDRQAKINLDISAVQAKLRALQAEKVSIDIDTGAAHAKVEALKVSINGLDRRDVSVGVEAQSAFARLAELGTQLRGIQGPVMIPIAIGGGLEVIQWIESVGGGLTGIGALAVASAGVAMGALQGVGDAVKALGETGPDAAKKIAEAMGALPPPAREFALTLRGIIDGPLKELQGTAAASFLPGLQEGLKGFFGELKNAQENVRGIGEALGKFFADIGPSAGRAADAFLRLANLAADAAFGKLSQGVTGALDSFTAWANSKSAADIAADIQEIVNTIQDLWNKATTAFDAIKLAWAGITFVTDMFTAPLDKINQLYQAIRNFAEHIPGLSGLLPELDLSMKNVATSADGVAKGTDAAGAGMTKMAGSADGANQAIKALNQTQQDAAAQFMSTEQANLRYQEAVGRLTDSIAKNGATVDIHSEKGRANREALLGMVNAANDTIAAMDRAGAPIASVTSTFEAQRQELIRNATQVMGNRTAAQQYIDKLLAVPKSVSTDVHANTATAMANLAALQARLAAVNGVLTVTPGTGTYGQGLGVYKSSGGWVGRSTSRGGMPFVGGPRGRDTVPGWLDPSEFVVRSSAAAEWGPLLEQINAGATPADVAGIVGQGGRQAVAVADRPGPVAAGPTVLQVHLHGVLAGDEDAFGRAVLSAIVTGVNTGVLPRTLLTTT